MDKNIMYYSLIDFFPKKEEVKKIYLEMTKEEKNTYKMYVYSLCFENEYSKDLIWEYLNGYEESLAELCKEYRIRKNKLLKRQKDEFYNRDET